MTSSTTLKKAYSEVDECLEILGTEYKKQIPIKLRDYIKKEKDTNYKKNINLDIPINEQNMMNESLQIIAFFNLKYWCKDEIEKERLKSVYKKNEEKFQKELMQKYDTDQLFKNKQKTSDSRQLILVDKKENWIKRLVVKLINTFFKK